jgi:diguanylate cyclase (GGDEF)-like protein
MLDLDEFGRINELLGRDGADLVLQEIGRRLAALAGAALRIGSDEFCVILPEDRGASGLLQAVARVIDIFAAPIRIAEQSLLVTARTGCALFPGDGGDSDALIESADGALRAARRARAAVLDAHYPIAAGAARDVLSLEGDLDAAVASAQLQLRYQPQVDARTGRINGCEALARWRHPKMGWVPPSFFIPAAERRGLMGSIGDWILRTAVTQVARWQEAGSTRVPVSINVSAQQLQRGFARLILDTLDAATLTPRDIKIELTETSVVHDVAAAAAILEELRAGGVEIALDDFGTGNASLSLLASLPLDILKIDRSFIYHLDSDEKSRRIVEATLGLAQRLELRVVAEGVATAAQRDWLMARGCFVMQGHLFGRAVDAAEMERRWLAGRVLKGDAA